MQGNQASSPGNGYVTRDLSSCSANMGYILELQRGWHSKLHFLVSTEILGFLSIFKKSQASSAFEALNSTSLWRCQVMGGPLSR